MKTRLLLALFICSMVVNNTSALHHGDKVYSLLGNIIE